MRIVSALRSLSRGQLVLMLAISMMCILLYLPSLNHELVNWDDDLYIADTHLKKIDLEYLKWAFTSIEASGYWGPMTWLSYGIDYTFWGLDPAGYRLTNMALHAFNTFLVMLLLYILLMKGTGGDEKDSFLGAFVVGTIFAFHPMQVESVVWISERKNVLYAFFWLLSLIAYTRYAGSDSLKCKIYAYFLALSFFLLSLLSKPMAVTLPVVLFILDFFPYNRLSRVWDLFRLAILEKLPFYVLSLGVAIITVVGQDNVGSINAMEYFDIFDRFWTAIKALGFYFAKLLLPFNLLPHYILPVEVEPMQTGYIVSLVLVLVITVVAIRSIKKAPFLITAYAYFIATLLPVLGIIQSGGQASADRYMYLPMLGPFLVFSVPFIRMWREGKKLRPYLMSGFLVMTLMLSVLTVRQFAVWENSITLWTHVLKHSPNDFKASYNLGHAYRGKGDYTGALNAWNLTLEIMPYHSQALNNIGNVYFTYDSFREAKKYYEKAVSADSDNAEAHYMLALTLENLNDHENAAKHFQKFIELAPPEYAREVALAKKKINVPGAKRK